MTWHCINEERADHRFMDETSLVCLTKTLDSVRHRTERLRFIRQWSTGRDIGLRTTPHWTGPAGAAALEQHSTAARWQAGRRTAALLGSRALHGGPPLAGQRWSNAPWLAGWSLESNFSYSHLSYSWRAGAAQRRWSNARWCDCSYSQISYPWCKFRLATEALKLGHV